MYDMDMRFSEEVDGIKAEKALIKALTAMSLELREHLLKALLASLSSEEQQNVLNGV